MGSVLISREMNALRKTLEAYGMRQPEREPLSPLRYLKVLIAADLRRLHGNEDARGMGEVNENALLYAEERLNRFFSYMGVDPEQAYSLVSQAVDDAFNLAWPNSKNIMTPSQTSPRRPPLLSP